MIQAESKSLLRLDSMHTGEKLLRSDGAVEGFARFQAIIAAVAALGKIFAEIPQQRRASAFPCFSIRDHGAQLLMRDPLFAFAFFLDKPPLFYYVADAEEKHAVARQTIASGASCFLVIPFDVLRQVVVNDVTHVRF